MNTKQISDFKQNNVVHGRGRINAGLSSNKMLSFNTFSILLRHSVDSDE